jgi:hypothetical protein
VENAGGKKLQVSLLCQPCLDDEFYRFKRAGQDRFKQRKFIRVFALRNLEGENQENFDGPSTTPTVLQFVPPRFAKDTPL